MTESRIEFWIAGIVMFSSRYLSVWSARRGLCNSAAALSRDNRRTIKFNLARTTRPCEIK